MRLHEGERGKLSLRLIRHRVMKTKGGVEVKIRTVLSSSPVALSSHVFPAKGSLKPSVQEAEWPPDAVETPKKNV